MEKVTTVGLDLAKTVFQVHGADRDGGPVMRKKLRRGQVLSFLENCHHVLLDWRPVPQRIIGQGGNVTGTWPVRRIS